MERRNILNPDSEVDLFCLHYFAVPLIECALNRFLLSWNHHTLRTEANQTPLQLFIAGLENLRLHEDGQHFTELEQVKNNI